MNKNDALILASEHKDKSSAVFVTADGNVFFAEHKNHALHHAKELNIEIFEFENDELTTTKAPKAEAKSEEKPIKKSK